MQPHILPPPPTWSAQNVLPLASLEAQHVVPPPPGAARRESGEAVWLPEAPEGLDSNEFFDEAWAGTGEDTEIGAELDLEALRPKGWRRVLEAMGNRR